MDLVEVKGNTYPVKDRLKALGGKWDAARKAWMVPASCAQEASEIVASAPRRAPADLVPITGNAYSVRAEIKALGGRWDGATKTWSVPRANYARAQALVPQAPRRGLSGKCRECGDESFGHLHCAECYSDRGW